MKGLRFGQRFDSKDLGFFKQNGDLRFDVWLDDLNTLLETGKMCDLSVRFDLRFSHHCNYISREW